MRTRLLLGLLLALGIGGCGSPSFRGSVMPDPLAVPDFVLTDQQGQRFRLSDQRGHVVLLFFGYTQCPDVCPTTLAEWRRVHEALGQDASRVRFVFITVDPERDTAERLGIHVRAFNPDFVGLTGTTDQLDAVYQIFDVYHEKDTSSGSAAGYLIAHTATTFVVDAEGRWRLRESYGTPEKDLVYDIRHLLDEARDS